MTINVRYILIKIALATLLIQSFVVSNVIKGLIISYVCILLHFAKDTLHVFIDKKQINIFPTFLIFICGFVAWQLLCQLFNALYMPTFETLPPWIMISYESASASLFRKSLFTQSAYLITCIIFFLYIYRYLIIYDEPKQVIKIVRGGLIFFVAFGFYEVIGYAVTGFNVDFISNRLVGEGWQYGLHQILTLGGITFQRMKSLSGEPSMLAFSVVPFGILFYYLKDKFYIILLVVAVLTSSTTAVVGILLFIFIETLVFKKMFRLISIILLIVIGLALIDVQILNAFYEMTIDKLTLQNASGLTRYINFVSSLTLFLNADIFHMALGHGFGYIRSTDGFSTLLVNTGFLGLITYCAFFLYPLLKLKYNSEYRKGLLVAMVISIVLIMVSVPDIYYFHIWFLAALAWYEYYKEKHQKVAEPSVESSPA